ncbi:DUF3277 family protein [Alkalihalophilus marmarensis]|uniref:phage structural protein n=1 Tax=Alkalihalophilus marmarensis TaxID=521377 RepID=UPI0020418EF1|nr:phage protein [Alkalihalophilus marmarensis]MCM3488779.1 DUF3277 family protein [Alkalihalophilus marmarensis]
MGTYNFNDTALIVDGVFITGFADGTGISAEKLEDNFTTKTTADGIPVTSESNDKRGLITVTLDQTSPSLSYLNSKANSKDEYSAWVIAPNEKAGGSRARVRKPANKEFGKESSERTFEIEVLDYEAA